MAFTSPTCTVTDAETSEIEVILALISSVTPRCCSVAVAIWIFISFNSLSISTICLSISVLL
ncbi:Uncharacterised protein [Vibrio cholerae]|nr:Uncharacterised protein [Vibrio cholerae]